MLSVIVKYTFLKFLLLKNYYIGIIIDKFVLNNIFLDGIFIFLINFIKINPELVTDFN